MLGCWNQKGQNELSFSWFFKISFNHLEEGDKGTKDKRIGGLSICWEYKPWSIFLDVQQPLHAALRM